MANLHDRDDNLIADENLLADFSTENEHVPGPLKHSTLGADWQPSYRGKRTLTSMLDKFDGGFNSQFNVKLRDLSD
jgi:hypothetical protein